MKKIFLILTISISLFAHGGRTDSNGGHNNKSTGEYHYHDGGYSKPNYNSSQYILSIFQYKQFKKLGDTYNSKKECMSVRYRLWVENRDNGWTYGCRKNNK